MFKVRYFDISPEGKHVVIRQNSDQKDDSTVFVYSYSGQLVYSFLDCNNLEQGVGFFGHWSKLLVPGCDEIKAKHHGLKLYDHGKKADGLPFDYAPVNGIRNRLSGVSPDGNFVLAAGERGPDYLITPKDSTFEKFYLPSADPLVPALFSQDNKLLIWRIGRNPLVGFSSYLIDRETQEYKHEFGKDYLGFLSQKNAVIVNSRNEDTNAYELVFTDFAGNLLSKTYQAFNELISAASAPDDNCLVLGDKRGTVYFFTPNQDTQLAPALIKHTDAVLKIGISSDCSSAITISSNEVHVWDIEP